MNLSEMIVVVCWKMEQYYENVEFEQYRPLIVPLGTHESDVRELVKHVYGEDAEFEMYERVPLDSGHAFQHRMVNPGAGSPTKTIIISDPGGPNPPICWVADGDLNSLLDDAKKTYPGRKVEMSQVVRVEPTEREFRYFVLG